MPMAVRSPDDATTSVAAPRRTSTAGQLMSVCGAWAVRTPLPAAGAEAESRSEIAPLVLGCASDVAACDAPRLAQAPANNTSHNARAARARPHFLSRSPVAGMTPLLIRDVPDAVCYIKGTVAIPRRQIARG